MAKNCPQNYIFRAIAKAQQEKDIFGALRAILHDNLHLIPGGGIFLSSGWQTGLISDGDFLVLFSLIYGLYMGLVRDLW